MTEYVTADRIAEIIPYTVRQIISLAKEGEVPGAFQLVDGGKWCFDERRARQWFKQREIACQKKSRTYTYEGKPGGVKLSLAAGKSTNLLRKRRLSRRENGGMQHANV